MCQQDFIQTIKLLILLLLILTCLTQSSMDLINGQVFALRGPELSLSAN